MLIAGLVIGAIFGFLAYGAAAGRFKVRWYQWLLAAAAAVMYLLAAQNYTGFQDELEPGIANFMLVMMGVPALALTALIWVTPMITGALGKGKADKASPRPT
jgi:hypothetical protein